MVQTIHTCPKCKKIFTRKSHYTYHINRKNPCIDTQNTVNNSEASEDTNKKSDENTLIFDKPVKQNGRFICKFCKKSFSRSDNYNRHIKSRCSGVISYLMKKINDVNKQLAEKDKQLALEKQNKTPKNTVLLGFGHEDVSRLTDSAYTRIFNLGKNSVTEFVKTLHFNEKLPEYHNIYITNLRGDFVLVYDGKDWNVQSKNEMLDDVYFDSVRALDDIYHKRIKDDPSSVVTCFEEFIEKFTLNTISNDIKRELRNLLYNHRHMAEAVRKQSSASLEAPQAVPQIES